MFHKNEVNKKQINYSDSDIQDFIESMLERNSSNTVLTLSRTTEQQKEDILSKGYDLLIVIDYNWCIIRRQTSNERGTMSVVKDNALKNKKRYLYKVTTDKPNTFCVVCAESVYDVQNILSTNVEYSCMSCIEIGEANKEQIRGILVVST
jgi:hypothetical protein